MTVHPAGLAATAAAREETGIPPAGGSAKTAEPPMDRLANKEVFLQLLVAQIRHQNPLKPAEGTEFVAQLAQFTQLELTLGIRKDLEQIRVALLPGGENTGGAAEAQPVGSNGRH